MYKLSERIQMDNLRSIIDRIRSCSISKLSIITVNSDDAKVLFNTLEDIQKRNEWLANGWNSNKVPNDENIRR